MIKFPWSRGKSKEVSAGGPERSQVDSGLQAAAEDPFAGLIGMLTGDRERLPDKSSIITELVIITGTRSLPSIEREKIADRVLLARAKSDSEEISG